MNNERTTLLPNHHSTQDHRHDGRRHSITSDIIDSRTVLVKRLSVRSSISYVDEEDGISSDNNMATLTAILNLTVAIAGGVGMVTLPGSFASVGYAEGTILLVISGLAAGYSCYLLNRSCRFLNGIDTSSYASLVAHTLGKLGSYVLEALTLTYCIGQVIAYFGAIGGQLVALLSLFKISLGHHQAVLYIGGLVMFPLSLLPDEGAMRMAGALGTLCMVYIVFAIILGDGISVIQGGGGFCSLAPKDADPMIAFSPNIVTMLQHAPIFLFSMNAAVTYVPVEHHLKAEVQSKGTKRSQRACMMLIFISLCKAGILYFASSFVAYAAYCSAVPENVVDVWPLTWIPGTFARGFLALELSVAASGIYIPLGRGALWHLLQGPTITMPPTGYTRIGITIGIIGVAGIGSVALAGALTLPLAVTSALCVTAQMFILPGLCASVLSKRSRSEGGGALVVGGSPVSLLFAAVGFGFGTLSLLALFGLL